MRRLARQSCVFAALLALAGPARAGEPHGDCGFCHERGAASRPAAPVRALCRRCHDDPSAGHRSVHRPVAEGRCDACHDVHRARVTKACAACHAAQTRPVRYAHAPVEQDGCPACHHVHASAERKLLVDNARSLCTSCHDDHRGGRHRYRALDASIACTGCHDAHGADAPHLLRRGIGGAR